MASLSEVFKNIRKDIDMRYRKFEEISNLKKSLSDKLTENEWPTPVEKSIMRKIKKLIKKEQIPLVKGYIQELNILVGRIRKLVEINKRIIEKQPKNSPAYSRYHKRYSELNRFHEFLINLMKILGDAKELLEKERKMIRDSEWKFHSEYKKEEEEIGSRIDSLFGSGKIYPAAGIRFNKGSALVRTAACFLVFFNIFLSNLNAETLPPVNPIIKKVSVLGTCDVLANNLRLRNSPDTNSEIIGKAGKNSPQYKVIAMVTKSNGDVWLEVEKDNSRAYLAAKYGGKEYAKFHKITTKDELINHIVKLSGQEAKRNLIVSYIESKIRHRDSNGKLIGSNKGAMGIMQLTENAIRDLNQSKNNATDRILLRKDKEGNPIYIGVLEGTYSWKKVQNDPYENIKAGVDFLNLLDRIYKKYPYEIRQELILFTTDISFINCYPYK